MAKRTSSRGLAPVWKLDDLYSGLKDPRIKKDLAGAERRAKKFNREYRGKITRKVRSAAALKKALLEFEAIHQLLAKPVVFANLEFSCAQNDPVRGAFVQGLRKRWTEINQHLMFFDVEILKMPAATLRRLAASKAMSGYSNYIEKLLSAREHILSEREEQLFSEFALSGRSAFVRLYNEERAASRYHVKGKGKRKELTENEAFTMLYDPSATVRAAAGTAITDSLKQDSRRLTFIFNTLLEDKETRDRYRNYRSPEASRHKANQISKRVVDTMVDVVASSYPTVHSFYRFKGKVLGIKKLAYTDRLAPVSKQKQRFTFKQAQNLILDAFDNFSGEYAGIAEEFFSRGWIDARPKAGKRSGAFCSFGTPDVHPYVFMNFKGTLRDVFTLAHELGHAIHGRLMNGAGYLNFSFPLTVAETASIFSEMLLFEHLVSQLANPADTFSLYVSSVENRFGSVFRQVSMHQFEQLFHEARREEGEQSVEQINEYWVATQRAMYGNSLDFKSEYDYWWMYIPHFIHTPFYVYAYSFGELLSIALFQRYKQKGESFVDVYLDMLASGGGAAPDELLKPLGVKLNSRAFWQAGVDYIDEQVKETKRLYRKL